MKKENNRHIPKKAVAYLATAALIGTLAIPGSLGLTGGAASATGDLNDDGSVTGADVLILQNALLGKTTLTPTQAQNADVCTDSNLNGLDLARLRQMAMGTVPQSDAILIHYLMHTGSSAYPPVEDLVRFSQEIGARSFRSSKRTALFRFMCATPSVSSPAEGVARFYGIVHVTF